MGSLGSLCIQCSRNRVHYWSTAYFYETSTQGFPFLKVDYIQQIRSSKCVSVSPSMLAKPGSRSAMLVGNFTALNMASSLMVKCQVTRQLVEETIVSTPFSLKLALENMSRELFLLILNQPWWMK